MSSIVHPDRSAEGEREPGAMFSLGARLLQDTFDSRRLADRLTAATVHEDLSEDDIRMIGAQTSVMLSTVDIDGWPDVSYKGGEAGFVRVVDTRTLVLPSYDGNGMFRTLGNIADTGRVALLFLDPLVSRRLRVHGSGVVITDPDVVAEHVGAQAVVRITIRRLFPNCRRCIHQPGGQISADVPRDGHQPPEPQWKSFPEFRDVLPRRGRPV